MLLFRNSKGNTKYKYSEKEETRNLELEKRGNSEGKLGVQRDTRGRAKEDSDSILYTQQVIREMGKDGR